MTMPNRVAATLGVSVCRQLILQQVSFDGRALLTPAVELGQQTRNYPGSFPCRFFDFGKSFAVCITGPGLKTAS
jgi:hypothetical protein